jgi:hypothetical protein
MPRVCGPSHHRSDIMDLPRIEDHALVEDRQSTALVGRDGSTMWLGLSRFDIPPGPLVAVRVGADFETAALPEQSALQVLDLLGHIRPHPVGAAIGTGGRWVLILPPGSGQGLHWPWPVEHRDTGVLSVPPLSAGPAEERHWARLGNSEGRLFTSPLLLHAVLPLLAPLPPPSPAAPTDPMSVRN